MDIAIAKLREFATNYTAAWCSQDAARVAAFFAENGSLKINEGAPSIGRTAIARAAQVFMTAFPDMVVKMDELSLDGGRIVYRWTLTGTNTGPGGTGKAVRISGYEEWTIGAGGLIAASKGHFDEAEYQRQLKAGVGVGSVLYLSREDVEATQLPMSEIIEALEAMFKEKGNGKVEMPPKPGIHPRPDAFIHAMPAYIPSLRAAGIKWVSGYPGNQARGLPYISGLLILNDPDTGVPIAVMDCTWITAQRTGAATAVSARYLARPDSVSIGIVACGVQGRSNLEALACLLKVQKVKAYDLYPEAAQRYAREMEERLHLDIEPVTALAEAVKGLDIVVTSGPILKNPQPLIEAGWLAPGSFASLVDFDSYWQGAALREVDKLVTDDLAQMHYYRQEGYFRETPTVSADLGEIVAGRKPGRESDDERTASINLGLALDDMATAILVYQRAKARGIGRELPL